MLKKIWHDPVWSKVIAAIIVGLGAWAISEIPRAFWDRLLAVPSENIGASLGGLAQWTIVGAGAVAGLGLLVWAILRKTPAMPGSSLTSPGPNVKPQKTPQSSGMAPNRLPSSVSIKTIVRPISALVGRGVRRPFSDLTDQQQQFLRQLFGRRSRHFYIDGNTTRARWFEELSNWKYLEAQRVLLYAGGDWPYEITEAGWSELEVALGRSGR